MGRKLFCAAAAAVLIAACSNAGPAPSLAGSWSGTITCYKMDSPLSMIVDAAKPAEAKMAMGEGGVFPWDAALSIDGSRNVTIKANIASGDAQLITGVLDAGGNTIVGAMDEQLCNKFTLTRAVG
ncbi:MAG: hypothetical protein EON93_08345 [Burkholderiales bacterium]|nr:MAG: hypothetical protein EON93_08345 [Burkholderiales bacterium]